MKVHNYELARIHRILDDEEARLKKEFKQEISIVAGHRIEGSLATVRKIREAL
jgi:hypothetical protein